jgi:hypothetical protein
MSQFDTQKVYRAAAQSGPWTTEITNPATRVAFIAGQTGYYFDDLTGDPDKWYAITYYNTATLHESNYSTPVKGDTATPTPIFDSAVLEQRANDIRAFLRDEPDFNILLDDVEFLDEDIARAMRFATARYNAMTPVTNVATEQLNEWVLVAGVCCILFRSEGARQLRNQVQAQDGNIAPVGIDEKQALYAQWADRMCIEFDALAIKIKMQNNMEEAYDTLNSGYYYLGRWRYNRW